jgi:hypothetical protein
MRPTALRLMGAFQVDLDEVRGRHGWMRLELEAPLAGLAPFIRNVLATLRRLDRSR